VTIKQVSIHPDDSQQIKIDITVRNLQKIDTVLNFRQVSVFDSVSVFSVFSEELDEVEDVKQI